jgi:hypothetical protein
MQNSSSTLNSIAHLIFLQKLKVYNFDYIKSNIINHFFLLLNLFSSENKYINNEINNNTATNIKAQE